MDEHLGYPMSPESYALVRSFWESAGLPLDELLSSRDATLQLLDAPNRLAQIVAMGTVQSETQLAAGLM